MLNIFCSMQLSQSPHKRLFASMLSGATSRATNEEEISMRNDRKQLIAIFVIRLSCLAACDHRNVEAEGLGHEIERLGTKVKLEIIRREI